MDYIEHNYKMNESSKWRINATDLERWLTNTLVFFAPVGVIYLSSVVGQLGDGFSFSDLALTKPVQGAMALYLVNVLLDFFKKLSAGPKS